jgi:predicted ATPase
VANSGNADNYNSMLTRVEISNYRSFLKADANLSPFTLVIGANGSGKSNFLRFFRDVNTRDSGGFRPQEGSHPNNAAMLMPHLDHIQEPTTATLERSDLKAIHLGAEGILHGGQQVEIFSLHPSAISASESVGVATPIAPTGAGVAALLDVLKTGAQEHIFDRIESDLRQFIPDVQKLSLAPEGPGKKSIQITLAGIKTPMPGKLLSDGTRILLALLAIIHQPTPPPLLLIEDLDHSLHPRLFEKMLDCLRDVCRERSVQVIATSHNPYLLDCFSENYDAVLVTRKVNGSSTISNFGEELRAYYANDPVPEMAPLSELYLRGYVGAADSPAL